MYWVIDEVPVHTDLHPYNLVISDENGNVVALVPGEGPDDKEMLRNARRITHAPEMSENYYAAHGLNIK